ncbi:MAG: DNA translocase FtsK [Anaerolineae bacterium]|nr:MAG: DNA translocase FtsK [Anaerolineae bacterium]
MSVPVGLDESGRVFHLTLGRGVTHHALVGGATGTGKTNLLHLLILMLSTTYSPQELGLYLVDFKEGVEFQDYVTRSLPHAKAVVLEAEREFGASILQRLVEEMERRSQSFKAVGVSDLPEYRRRAGKAMPRILLVMDEYVVLFSEDDRLSFQASEALGALVMRGRSFGIHVLLSAQRPASTFLSMVQIKNQMGLRIALKCRPDDSTLILGEGNEKAAKLVQAGEACVTSDPDRIDATVRIRIARLEPSERTLYLGGLREFAQLQHYSRLSEMIVFSRDAQAPWPKSPAIARRLTSPAWNSLATPQFWLGQPLRIMGDLAVELAAEQGANLLVLGSDADLSARLLIASVLGLSISIAPDQARFVFIGAPNPQQPSGAIWTAIGAAKAHVFEMTSRQAAVDTVGMLMSELDTRLNGLPTQVSKRIFLVLAGLHQWYEARGPNPYTPSPAGESLNRILQQGPQVGIHTLAWCDRLNTLGSVIGTGSAQDALAYFSHRVAMQTTQDESVNFIGVPHASKLGSERAYYRSERWAADELEKFKPFALPSVAEAASITSTIKAHWTKP